MLDRRRFTRLAAASALAPAIGGNALRKHRRRTGRTASCA